MLSNDSQTTEKLNGKSRNTGNDHNAISSVRLPCWCLPTTFTSLGYISLWETFGIAYVSDLEPRSLPSTGREKDVSVVSSSVCVYSTCRMDMLSLTQLV